MCRSYHNGSQLWDLGFQLWEFGSQLWDLGCQLWDDLYCMFLLILTQGISYSQLLWVENEFLEKKSYFFGNKTVDQRFCANSKKLLFAKFYCKFFAFLSFMPLKHWKLLFWPAFGVRSTQMLVEIYNSCSLFKTTGLQNDGVTFRKKV